MDTSSRSGEHYSLPVRILLHVYYTFLLVCIVCAIPCILVTALLFDDDRPGQ